MNSTDLERCKEFYRSGLWNILMLDALLKKKCITKSEYDEIKSARD
jgi:hypothetical protein